MEYTPLVLTSITNFILASEAYFVSGLLFARPKTPRSAAWYWQWAMFALSTSALIGGIDHGFFEIHGQLPIRKVIEHFNWFVIGGLTLLVFLSLAAQFLSAEWRRRVYWIAGAQFVAYTGLIVFVDNFLVVMLNYAPVMLLLLALSAAGLRTGRGSWAMLIGVAISFIASGLQAAGVDAFTPFDRNSLYHFGMMIAVACFYFAGRQLQQ